MPRIAPPNGDVIKAASMPLTPEYPSVRVSCSSSLSLSAASVPMPPQASAIGASGPRLAPAMSDTKAVITIPGALR